MKTKEYTKVNNDNKNLQQQVKQLQDHEEVLRKLLEDRDIQIKEAQCINANQFKLLDEQDASLTEPVNIGQMMKSIQHMMERKMTEMESKIETIVENKMGEKMSIVTGISETNNDQGSSWKTVNRNNYASVASGPKDFRIILQEAENEKLVEGGEKEKRANNFIVHGLQETGEQSEQVKINDVQTITKLLEVVGVGGGFESCTRLGKNELNKKRTLKVVMKTKQGKNDVLKNLRELKGSEKIFGKISVTDDYTANEKEQIKRYVEEAKAKSTIDVKNVWRVRGDPKNGLKLVSFPREKVASS